MTRATLLILIIATGCSAGEREGQNLTSATVPAFLQVYQQALGPLDDFYADMARENLPLLDESGRPLGRQHIDNRRQALADLRQTVHQLTIAPDDLVLAATLLVETESLTDDLFDLSQIAYDNDREELGNRLSDLEASMDQNKSRIQSYALSLAAEKQRRIGSLEAENRRLKERLNKSVHKAAQ